ncbi:MAG: hypothetical protein J0I07_01335, partial [Myxococcales bacterium]|nr:hypothetical protein [Myxococcales bacterium]
MRGLLLPAFVLATAACGGAATSPAVPSSSPTIPTSGAVLPAPRSFEEEAHGLLVELVSVDTSRGRETDALRPIAEKLKQAGVPAEIIESAPGRGNLIARLKGNGSKR